MDYSRRGRKMRSAGAHGVRSSHVRKPLQQKPNAQQPATKKTISAGALFKQPKQQPKLAQHDEQTAIPVEKSSASRGQVQKTTFKPKQISSPIKQQKVRVVKSRRTEHSLALAFKKAKDEYRTHLYTTTTSEIESTLHHLLTELHATSLAPQNGTSPTGATKLETYDSNMKKLYQPLAVYNLRLTTNQTNEAGKPVQVLCTLDQRMRAFEQRLEQHKQEVASLQAKWEIVVGEIWKVGVVCLGKEAMVAAFSIAAPESGSESAHEVNKTRAVSEVGDEQQEGEEEEEEDIESTLFVTSSSPTLHRKTSRPKKRVTFHEPNHDSPNNEIVSTPHSSPPQTAAAAAAAALPAFLSQPSRIKPLPAPPSLDAPEMQDAVADLKDRARSLGTQQVVEMQQVEKKYKEYWRKKASALASVLEAEDQMW